MLCVCVLHACARACVCACGHESVVRVCTWVMGGVRVCAWRGLRALMCVCVRVRWWWWVWCVVCVCCVRACVRVPVGGRRVVAVCLWVVGGVRVCVRGAGCGRACAHVFACALVVVGVVGVVRACVL